MGWMGRSLGDFGAQLGEAKDINQRWQDQYQNMLMKKAQFAQQQMMWPLQFKELQTHLNQMNVPEYKGNEPGPGGSRIAITRNPGTGDVSTKPLVPATITPEFVKQSITQALPELSDPDKKYVQNYFLGALANGADPAKVHDEWGRFYSSAAKAQKQKKPDIDLAKGVVSTYDAFGNATPYQIYDEKGNPNPNLPTELRPLVASEMAAHKIHLKEEEDTAQARSDAAFNRMQAGWDHQQTVKDKSVLDADANKAVAAAKQAFDHYQSISGSSARIRNGIPWYKVPFSSAGDVADEQTRQAMEYAEQSRQAAVDALTAAGRTVPPQLRNPIGPQVGPPTAPPPPGFVLEKK